MAKVTGPLHSSEARGAVGSLVYNTWRGISTVRTRVTPVKENEAAQLDIRAKCKSATIQWQSLTDAQREDWAQYAKIHTDPDWTGNPKRLSGYNWYIRVNVRRQLLIGTIIDTPPRGTLSFVNSHFFHSQSAGQINLTWPSDTNPYGAALYMEIYGVGPLSAARFPTIKNAKRSGSVIYSALAYTFLTAGNGRYTIWFRPILTSGVAGMWGSIVRQYTGG